MAIDSLKAARNVQTQNNINQKVGNSNNLSAVGNSGNNSSSINGSKVTKSGEAFTAIKVSISKEGQQLLTNKPPVNDSKIFKSITNTKKQNDSKLKDSYLKALSESIFKKRQAIEGYQSQQMFMN